MPNVLNMKSVTNSVTRFSGLAFILFLFFGVVSAQNNTFKWSDMACEYSGTFDTKKYSLSEIRDTAKLNEITGLPLGFQAAVWKYEDIEKLDLAELDREYKAKREELTALRPVKTAYWEKVKQDKLKELDQLHRLLTVTAKAYKNPEVLREYPGVESCKLKYAEPIISGGEKLVAAWRTVNLESQAKNSDPARLQRRFDSENASTDRMKFALVETMSFGWWNCANDSIEYINEDGSRQEEFKKLFVRVRTIMCEEP